MKVQCSYCSEYREVEPKYRNKMVSCYACGKKFLAGSHDETDSDNDIPPIPREYGCMALFDFKFHEFISPAIIRVLYILGFGLVLLTDIIILIGVISIIIKAPLISADIKGFLIVFAVVAMPILSVIQIAFMRMNYEFAMAIFNMERFLRNIERNTRRM